VSFAVDDLTFLLADNSDLNDLSPVPEHVGGAASPDDNNEPPAKRRKVADPRSSQKSSPRPISPPWKRIAAEGPTSFIEGGRRRSARTNIVPLELQPQTNKRQTRAAFDKAVEDHQKHARPVYNLSTRKKTDDVTPSKVMAGRASQTRPPEPARPVKVEQGVKHKGESPSLTRASQSKSPRRTQTGSSLQTTDAQPQINGVIKHESGESEEEWDHSSTSSSRLPSPPLTLQKVTFRVRLPKPTVATPANIPPPKKYTSFQDFLEHDELESQVGQDILTPEQVHQEAVVRRQVREAQKPGELLDKKTLQTLPEKQAEPKRPFAHRDHLLAHICHFRALLRAEQKDHKRKAELLAHEAKKYVEERSRRNKVKTAEEIEQERRELVRATYKGVVKDVDKLWAAVKAEVNAMRQKEYEEQQQAKMKGHLARVLDRTDQMLNRTADLDESVMDTEFESDVSSNGTSEVSSDSEQMSESETESESDLDADNVDAEMSIEDLQRKYGNLPDLEPDTEDDHRDDNTHGSEREELVDEESDPDTEMDSEFDTDDSGGGSSEEEDGEDDDDGDTMTGGLLSLFSKRELAEMAPPTDGEASPEDVVMEDEGPATPSAPLIQVLTDEAVDEAASLPPKASRDEAVNEVNLEHVPNEASVLGPGVAEEGTMLSGVATRSVSEEAASQEGSSQPSPHTSATKASEADSVSSIDPRPESPSAATPPSDPKPSSIKTPVPKLLRGTLREYQHEGLDWLADLYAHGRSGILADEMGLGKTIQSIALLAHLAEVYQVWGPHLIVVPTSVMLNWEMEFKKFLPGFKILTYYGTLEERKQKRRGWMADDSFNVCITSYQLVLQDANSFKRRKWHYMILDEAHNIKNFRSERWQTMMTFNTKARLLLTGTPLQNNLTELWSLLFFLHYGQDSEGEDDAFAGLKEWSEWFRRPVESILEHGRQVLDQEDKEQVAKLHKVIRPFLLRRLKADVEKQMPLKYEHIEMCRLSKRQRQLYDGFMARAQTKETLASGNYLSIINALMQLRKVCNHPDLFETRPINTSFAMPKSVAAEYEVQDLLVRRRLLADTSSRLDLDFLQLAPICHEDMSMIDLIETTRRHAYHQFKTLRDAQWRRLNPDSTWHGDDRRGVLASLESVGRQARLQELDRTMYYEAYRHHQHPVYGRGLIQRLTVGTTYDRLSRLSTRKVMTKAWETEDPIRALGVVHSIQTRSEQMEPLIQQYGCVTPAAVATDLSTIAVTEAGRGAIRATAAPTSVPTDPFHVAQMKLSIAFPDKRLLQYDCGKLQRLDKLLRELQAGGHRALIFTQMTKVLDILEQFLNIHGHRYLRLDGATKIEQRQILTDRFNNDPRILAFILSSRSGGLGINLTGADTVIFYDLDWNPAMDKQCTDRAHRIGQTRDVHIYRFVSEHTIESNILRKANQKQMLDDVVIQEGDFTTDYRNKLNYRDMLDAAAEDDAAGAAMDRVLGNERGSIAALGQAEDQEDSAAAKVAAREVQHADDGDFEDKMASTTPKTNDAPTPGPFGATNAALAEAGMAGADEGIHHIDDYLIELQKYLVRDVPLGPPKDRRKKGKKKRDEHRVRRTR